MSSAAAASKCNAITVAPPATKGYTSFPKEILSYGWVISNAGVVLRDLVQGLRSPPIFVPLQLYPRREKYEVTFYLQLDGSAQGNSVFLYVDCAPNARSSGKSGSRKRPHASREALSVYSRNSPHILISDCKLSILNPNTGGVKHTANVPNREFGLIDPVRDFGVVSFIKQSQIDSCIVDDTLTIQVDATILCISNPIEMTNEISYVPTSKRMKALLYGKLYSDITIKCDDEEFEVHKAILASQSPVFKTMLQTDMREKNSNVLEISDMEPAVVSDLLEFMYTGKAPNIREFATDLLYAANKYELPGLFTMCENELMMTLTVDNVIERILLGHQHEQAANLKMSCLKFIVGHSMEVYRTKGWKALKNSSASSDLVYEIVEFGVGEDSEVEEVIPSSGAEMDSEESA